MKTIARLVTRPSGDAGNPPDLIVGALVADQTALQAGRVYEIREILGELTIVDIGEANIGPTVKTNGLVGWGSDINHVLATMGKRFFLTRREAEKISQ